MHACTWLPSFFTLTLFLGNGAAHCEPCFPTSFNLNNIIPLHACPQAYSM